MKKSPPLRDIYLKFRWPILLVMFFSFPLLGWEAWRALQNSDNSVRQWLPLNNRETADFDWFIERFRGEEVVVASWSGCTINDPRLETLALELEQGAASGSSAFDRVQTSTRLLGQLTDERFGLARTTAIDRLRGTFVGPDGKTGCAIMSLSAAGKLDRHAAIANLQRIALERCGIPSDALRLAGPVVDNVALEFESQESIRKYLPLCIGLVLLVGIWALRSPAITICVFLVAAYNTSFSLALLRWSDVPMNLVLIMLPTLVYVLSISSAVHLVNYFKEAASRAGRKRAPFEAVRDGWKPCLFAALTTALGLVSLGVSEIAPVRDFGIFSAISICVSLLTTFLFLPTLLGLCRGRAASPLAPPHGEASPAASALPPPRVTLGPVATLGSVVCQRHAMITLIGIALLVAIGVGVTRTTSTVRLLGNFSEEHRILQDYQWMEENIGPMIPVEIVISFDGSAGLNNLERMEYVLRTGEALTALDEVGGTISAATFLPDLPQRDTVEAAMARRAIAARVDQATAEFSRAGLLNQSVDQQAWRISARMKALEDIDYGEFIDHIRRQVEPLLVDETGRRLEGAHVKITGIIPLVYRAQRQLLNDLAMSFVTAFVIISIVTAFVVRSAAGGCVAMIPNLFPVMLVFGSMGLLGIPVRISAVLTASAALGIAVDDTLHFFTWVRRSMDQGADRRGAVGNAYSRCAPAMFQTTLINGIGMLVYAFTLFLPTRLFATLMFSLLGAALVGDLVILPALLVGPLGKFLLRRKVSLRPAHRDSHAPERSRPAPAASPSAGIPRAAPRLVVPRRRRSAGAVANASSRLSRQATGLPLATATARAGDQNEPLVTPAALEGLRREILSAAANTSAPALLFAATDSGRDSAATVLLLARTLAVDVDRLLVMDFSPSGRVAKELGRAATVNLRKLLDRDVSWPDCVVPTNVSDLSLLPAKPNGDRVSTYAFRRWLNEVRTTFGAVLIDVGAYDECSLRQIAAACDGAYLTVRADTARPDRIRSAKRRLRTSGARLGGSLSIEAPDHGAERSAVLSPAAYRVSRLQSPRPRS